MAKTYNCSQFPLVCWETSRCNLFSVAVLFGSPHFLRDFWGGPWPAGRGLGATGRSVPYMAPSRPSRVFLVGLLSWEAPRSVNVTIILGAGKSQIKMLAGLVLENCLLGLQMATFSACPHMPEKERARHCNIF